MRKLVLLLSAVVAVEAMAYRGRPVSNLTFDPVTGALAKQSNLTLAAGPDGYLAAWYERGAVRAARIDRAGNYRDGDGIVLASAENVSSILIDGKGPHWFVVWGSRGQDQILPMIRGRSISYEGIPALQTIEIGAGDGAAVAWNATHYVVQSSTSSVVQSGTSLSVYIRTVSLSGSVGPAMLLIAGEKQLTGFHRYSWDYSVGSFLSPQNSLIALVEATGWGCAFTPIGSGVCGRVGHHAMGLSLGSVAPLFRTPHVIDPVSYGGLKAVASETQIFAVWSYWPMFSRTGYQLSGSVFRADEQSPTADVSFDAGGAGCAVASDGTDFVVTWPITQKTLATARIGPDAAVIRKTTLGLADGESAFAPVAAGSTTLPVLIGFIDEHPLNGNVPRAMLLFESEWGDVSSPPRAPAIGCVVDNRDGTATVNWEPVAEAFGVSIESELPNGTFRQIAVAPSNATTARVPVSGSGGDEVRVRAWNAGGLSLPSATVPSLPVPAATLRSTMRACAGAPATVSITLSGTPPFTLHWSDGFVQKNVRSTTASREVTLTRNTTLSIVAVEDMSCTINRTTESIRITVDPLAAITAQTHDVRIRRGESATLSVTATTGSTFAWFEGARGNTSHPVGANSPSFTTPALTQSTGYWVRVSNRCGSVDSNGMTVVVQGKRRAARR